MIYEQVTKNDFRDAFKRMDRGDNFSYEALGALYDYVEEMSNCDGANYELDVIALCCDYSEMLIEEVLKSYNLDSLDELKEETQVIWHDDSNVLFLSY